MRILTDKEYAGFKDFEARIDRLTDELKTRELHSESLIRKIEAKDREIDLMQEDHDREVSNLHDDVEMKIAKATEKMKDELRKEKSDKDSALKEVAMLTKAFENLGFDVKDMKNILDKLVDGLVSKNAINLLKVK